MLSVVTLGSMLNGSSRLVGGIAQLGERLHGMQEVSGSIPLTSTIKAALVKWVFLFDDPIV
jgi:hypothetical protein